MLYDFTSVRHSVAIRNKEIRMVVARRLRGGELLMGSEFHFHKALKVLEMVAVMAAECESI